MIREQAAPGRKRQAARTVAVLAHTEVAVRPSLALPDAEASLSLLFPPPLLPPTEPMGDEFAICDESKVTSDGVLPRDGAPDHGGPLGDGDQVGNGVQKHKNDKRTTHTKDKDKTQTQTQTQTYIRQGHARQNTNNHFRKS